MEMSKNCPTYEGGPRVLAQHSLSHRNVQKLFPFMFFEYKSTTDFNRGGETFVVYTFVVYEKIQNQKDPN